MAYLATIAAFGFTDFNPPSLLRLYRRLGCRACQFYRCTTNPPQPADARRVAEDAGLPFDSMHGLFGPEHDPSSPDEATRRRAIETYRAEGDLAHRLGKPLVVVHPAPPSGGAPVTPASRAARVDPLRRSIAEMARLGERLGVTYLIENLPPNYCFGADPIELGRLVREADHPRLRMCLDIGHAHIFGPAAAAVEACADVIGYVHAHDNDGKADSHQVPGRGGVPWDAVGAAMAKLPAGTPAMLELFESEQALEGEIAAGLPAKLRPWLGV